MIENKNIVIIGGTSGIGLSAAKAFIRYGAKVVVVGRDRETNRQAQQELNSSGIVFSGDAIEENTASDAIKLCQKTWGSLDGLYHVAGGSGRKLGDGPLHEITLNGWNETLKLNLTSVMLSNRAAVKSFMDEKKRGTILNLGSVLGSFPAPHYFATHSYAAAKAAIIGFSKSIAAYYAKYNIRVNVLAPALIETPMSRRATSDEAIMRYIQTKQPLDGGRIGKPEDLDEAAAYFMSDSSAFTTGQVLTIDGGWSINDGQIFSKLK